MTKTKKPLRRASNGRFTESMAEFTPEELARALQEFAEKQKFADKSAEFIEGYKAYIYGAAFSANTHEFKSEKYMQFYKGWDFADNEGGYKNPNY